MTSWFICIPLKVVGVLWRFSCWMFMAGCYFISSRRQYSSTINVMKSERLVNKGEKENSSENTENSSFNDLNDDCILEIFARLSVAERMNVMSVCSRWEMLSKISLKSVKKIQNPVGHWYSDRVFKCNRKVFKRAICLSGKSIKSIGVHCFAPSTSLLSLIEKKCPNLQELDFTGVLIEPSTAEFMAEKLTNITHFSTGEFSRGCEEYIRTFLKNNQRLKSIKVHYSSEINGTCLSDLPEAVESIHLVMCWRMKVQNFLDVFKKCHNLKSLRFEQSSVDIHQHIDSVLKILPRKDLLQTLEIIPFRTRVESRNGGPVSDISELFRGSFKNLQSLSLEGQTVNDDNLKRCANHLATLKEISLSRSTISRRGLMELRKLPSLEYLTFNELKVTDGTERIFESPWELKTLKYIVKQNFLTKQDFRDLFKNAKKLKILYMPNFFNANWETLINDVVSIKQDDDDDAVLTIEIDEYGKNLERLLHNLIVKSERKIMFCKY